MFSRRVAQDPRIAEVVDNCALSHARAREVLAQMGVDVSHSTVRRVRAERGMSRADSLRSDGSSLPESGVASAPVRRDQHVPTWNARIEHDGERGELATRPRLVSAEHAAADVTPDEVEVLSEFGLSAAEWRVTSLRRSRWQKHDGEWLEAFRASFARRGASGGARVSEEEAAQFLAAYPASPVRTADGGRVVMAPMGDTQLGKPDGVGGTSGTVERFADVTAQVAARLEESDGADALVLPWLGDCLEGYVAQGGRNIATLDLSITEQCRLYRRMMYHQIATLAPLASRVLVPVVAGNHDEATRVQSMGPGDSWALEGAAAVSDVVDMAPERLGHVDFVFPSEGELGVSVNVGTEEVPYTIHFTHGHVSRNPNSVLDWWRKQTHGRQPAGAADMLVTAHYHHLRVEQTGGGRVWLQIPAMDGGSGWFRRSAGEEAAPGQVSMEVVGGPVGFADLRFHS